MSEPRILPGCTVLPPTKPPCGRSDQPTIGADRKPTSKNKAKGRPGERFRTLNAFVDFTAGTLTRAELLTWLVLFRDTRPDGLVRTAQTDLARRAGVDVTTIKRAVARLARRGLLRVVRRGSLRRGPSTYRISPLVPLCIPPER